MQTDTLEPTPLKQEPLKDTRFATESISDILAGESKTKKRTPKAAVETTVASTEVVESPVTTPEVVNPVTEKPADNPITPDAPITETTPATGVTDFDSLWKKESEPQIDPAKPQSPVSEKGKERDTEKSDSELIARWKKIESDPKKKFIIDSLEQGVDIVSLVRQVEGVDVASLDGEGLIREECRREKITDPDKIEIELDSYRSLSPLQQSKQDKARKAELMADQNERLEKLAINKSAETKDRQDTYQKVQEKLYTETSAILNDIVDKEYFGIKADPGAIKATRENIDSTLGLFNQDGTFNAKKMVRLAFLDANLPVITEVTARKWYTKAKSEELSAHSRPDSMQTTSKPHVVEKSKRDSLEDLLNP